MWLAPSVARSFFSHRLNTKNVSYIGRKCVCRSPLVPKHYTRSDKTHLPPYLNNNFFPVTHRLSYHPYIQRHPQHKTINQVFHNHLRKAVVLAFCPHNKFEHIQHAFICAESASSGCVAPSCIYPSNDSKWCLGSIVNECFVV